MEGSSFAPESPAAVAAEANAALRRWTRCSGRRRPPRSSWSRPPPARPSAPTWPPSRPPRWSRSRTARSPSSDLAWSSTADWFTHTAGIHRRAGSAAVRHAKLLVRERSLTRDALRDGLVSPEQAGIICDAIEELPTNAATRELAEKTLLDQAGRLHATDLARAARHLIHVVDPEGAERKAEKDLARQDRAAHLNRFLAIVEDGAGGVRLRGRGTVEDAAKIKAALLPLTRPTPADQAGQDCGEVEEVRDHGARMWDALVEHLRARAGHRPAARRPRRPAPGRGHHQPRRAAGQDRLEHDLRRRRRAVTRRDPAAGVRRRHHPRRPRHPRRGPRRRPRPPPRHPRPVAGAGLPRPALRVPRLHQAPGDGPRPPHRALGRPRPHRAWRTWCCCAGTTTGSSTTPRGRSGSTPRRQTRVPATTQTGAPPPTAAVDPRATPTRVAVPGFAARCARTSATGVLAFAPQPADRCAPTSPSRGSTRSHTAVVHATGSSPDGIVVTSEMPRSA